MEDDVLKPENLEPSMGDRAHQVGEAALSAIPYIGGPLKVFFDAVIERPLERRKRLAYMSLCETVQHLQSKHGIDIESLAKNEAFLDVAFQATEIACRTREKEKLEALQAAIMNAGLPGAPEISLQHIFLNLVEDFTPWHVNILDLFDAPDAWFERAQRKPKHHTSGPISLVLKEAFPELVNRQDFYTLIWRDLHSRGLVNTDSLEVGTRGPAILDRRTTDIGQQFLGFIRNKE